MHPEQPTPSNHLVNHLPGRGEGLRSRGWDVIGRETLGAFREMPFADKVHAVAQELHQHFCHAQARVVAVSFGAYLFLNAQAQLQSYLGRVLLLSPIVGLFADEASGTYFVPLLADLQLRSNGHSIQDSARPRVNTRYRNI